MSAHDGSDGHDRPRAAGRGDLHDSADRLERAVEDLVQSATGAAQDTAGRVVDELERAARRLREKMDGQGAEGEAPGREHRRSRRERVRERRREHRAHLDAGGGERACRANGWLRDLYREPDRGWIAGVCAGVARHYQVEPWVARLVAFSLLLFIPQIAFWAYIIAIFMLKRRPADGSARASGRRPQEAGRSPAPELGPRLAPRNGVRTLRVRFRDMELRMRRMESYVTSREFTLTRELSALEREGGRNG